MNKKTNILVVILIILGLVPSCWAEGATMWSSIRSAFAKFFHKKAPLADVAQKIQIYSDDDLSRFINKYLAGQRDNIIGDVELYMLATDMQRKIEMCLPSEWCRNSLLLLAANQKTEILSALERRINTEIDERIDTTCHHFYNGKETISRLVKKVFHDYCKKQSLVEFSFGNLSGKNCKFGNDRKKFINTNFSREYFEYICCLSRSGHKPANVTGCKISADFIELISKCQTELAKKLSGNKFFRNMLSYCASEAACREDEDKFVLRTCALPFGYYFGCSYKKALEFFNKLTIEKRNRKKEEIFFEAVGALSKKSGQVEVAMFIVEFYTLLEGLITSKINQRTFDRVFDVLIKSVDGCAKK